MPNSITGVKYFPFPGLHHFWLHGERWVDRW